MVYWCFRSLVGDRVEVRIPLSELRKGLQTSFRSEG